MMAEFRLTPPRDPGAMGALYGAEDGMPSWLQSGMMNVPRGVRPTVPIDLQQSEPGAAAAYRMQQAVRPDFGRPGEGPSVASILAATPLGLVEPISKLAMDVGPELATGGAYAPMRGNSSIIGAAQGAEFSEPQPQRPSDVQKQIKTINDGIAPQQTKLDRLKANFEAGRIDKNEYNRQRVPLESQLERGKGQVTEIDAPYQRELKAWETRKNDFLTKQSTSQQELDDKKANAELPFRIKHPDATKGIIGGGNALTGVTALATGLLSRGKIKPTLGVMGVGGLEGAVTGNVPELLDLGGYQPKGGPGWQKTRDEFFSPDNLIKTGSEAGLHAAGAGGISYGSSFGPKIAARLGEYGSKIRGAFSGGRAPPEAPMSPPPSMEELLSGPSGGNPMQSAPSMPPIPPNMQGAVPGMMSAPSTLPVPEPLPSPVSARAPRSPRRPPLVGEPVLTAQGWIDPLTGRLMAPPPLMR